VQQSDARIISNEPIAESWRELVLSWEAEAPRPGQFLTLRATSFSDPLLRRPFAFSSYRPAGASGGPSASIIYQVRGGATRLLSELSPGSEIDALGPLGVGFPPPEAGETAIVAGGGIGIGPLLFLRSSLASDAGAGPAGGAEAAPRLVLGFRTSSLVPRIDLPEGSVICTDDGSAGFRGTPVDWISRNAPAGAVCLYGCGPLPMLAALAELASARGWRAFLSAEQWMACGVGACMGCALPRSDGSGYLRACADGPVFEASAIDWRPRP
jgi:dihydroorotate dehydrogenase electron transfer subunit